MKNKFKPSKIFLGAVLFLMYLPIVLVVIYSFNESKISSTWSGFSLKWYVDLFQDKDIFEALLNSIIVAVCSCTISAIIGTLGAVGLPRIRWRGKGIMEYISTLPIMIPEIILGMVFMTFFALIGMPFGMITLIAAHTAFCIPYIYMMVKARLVGMDKSLAEAARDLGAKEHNVFFDITLPLIAPAIVSGMFLSFAMSFDDVIISIFVTGPSTNTLPIIIYTQMKTGVTPEINALSTIMLCTTVLLLLLSILANKKNKPNIKMEENK